MKILFLSTRAPYPTDTGHFQRTYNTLKQLSRFSDIHFVGFYDKGLDDESKKIVYDEIGKLCEQMLIESVPAETSKLKLISTLIFSFLGRRPFIVSKFFVPRIHRIIQNEMTDDIDIVHVDMLPLVEYVKSVSKVPVVLTNHNVESLRLKRRADTEKNWLLKKYLKSQSDKLYAYEKAALGIVKRCIAVSEEDKRLLQQINNDCLYYVVPNGVDSEFYKPQEKSFSGRRLLWIGNQADPYNRPAVQYFARDIFPAILNELPDTHWTVVGKSPPDEVNSLKNHYPANVTLAGYVDDVRDYYNNSDILVAPLLSGSGTKLKIIEAMSMAMPIVTTSIGAEGISAKHGRDFLIADNPALFVSELLRLLSDRTLQKTLSENSRNIAVSTYDWEKMGQQWNLIYKSILEE